MTTAQSDIITLRQATFAASDQDFGFTVADFAETLTGERAQAWSRARARYWLSQLVSLGRVERVAGRDNGHNRYQWLTMQARNVKDTRRERRGIITKILGTNGKVTQLHGTGRTRIEVNDDGLRLVMNKLLRGE